MKAVILAAGIASRLRPLTDTTPKCLLKIGERCLLERAFDALIQNGFNEFIIVTGYRQQQIVDFLQAHYPAQSITFIYNDKYESTNNIYSLWLTRPYTEGEEVLLLDSDIVFDPQIVEKLLRSDKADVLALNRHELGAEEIKVIVDNEQKVVEISKVCSIPDAIGESIGIEKMSAAYTQALFRELEMMILSEGLDNIFYERAFERLIPQGYSSSFFKKDSSTAGVRAIFPSSTIRKIGGISSVKRINLCTVILPTPKPCATLSSVRNFVTTCDEVKSVRKPCRFMASDFIL